MTIRPLPPATQHSTALSAAEEQQQQRRYVGICSFSNYFQRRERGRLHLSGPAVVLQ